MKTKTIKQKAFVPAEPSAVYKALMNSKEHSAFTGAKATIKDKAGMKFTAYDGYISGKNLELIKGKKIVQSWSAGESNWPDGHFSKVTFELKKKGTGTKIIFTHSNVPVANAKSLSNGWKQFYWNPMKKYFMGENRSCTFAL